MTGSRRRDCPCALPSTSGCTCRAEHSRVGLSRGDRRGPGIHVDAVGPGKISRDHGRVKSDQSSAVAQVGKQGRHIAAASKDLRICANELQVEVRQQIVAAVTSARAEDGPHFRSAEHFMQFADPPLHGSRQNKGLVRRSRVNRMADIPTGASCRSQLRNLLAGSHWRAQQCQPCRPAARLEDAGVQAVGKRSSGWLILNEKLTPAE